MHVPVYTYSAGMKNLAFRSLTIATEWNCPVLVSITLYKVTKFMVSPPYSLTHASVATPLATVAFKT